jgi:hypothetical protein
MPTAQGHDEMKYVGLWHLNSYTYGDLNSVPGPQVGAMYNRVTKGMLSGEAGEKSTEVFKINGEYINTPEKAWLVFRSVLRTSTSRRRRVNIPTERPRPQAIFHER